MKRDHYVMIETPRLDGEATTVIGVQLSDGLIIDVDLAGQDFGEEGYRGFSHRYFGGGGLGRLGFSGADSLAGLDHVTFYGLS